ATYSATRLKTDDGFCRQALIRTGNRRALPVGGFALAAVTVECPTKAQPINQRNRNHANSANV
uniref:hypothetical protein n=1 Tax=uncultured Lacticaseibacillus sp. TaxID=2775882 RepID=UPI00259881BC